jgi:hypothetical protein
MALEALMILLVPLVPVRTPFQPPIHVPPLQAAEKRLTPGGGATWYIRDGYEAEFRARVQAAISAVLTSSECVTLDACWLARIHLCLAGAAGGGQWQCASCS